MVTVAVRRVDLDRTKEEAILHHLDPNEFFLLANTAGCYNADDAVRYARLAPICRIRFHLLDGSSCAGTTARSNSVSRPFAVARSGGHRHAGGGGGG